MRIVSAICSLLLPLSGLCNPDVDAQRPVNVDRLIVRAMDLKLAEESTWLRLLHFETEPRPRQSLIRTATFFVSPVGHRSPRAELVALLEGIDFSDPEPGDDSLLCRYPARYLWLRTRLPLPDFDPARGCSRFAAWAKLDRVESVSLMLISGYFGNPASTFGHALMKINNGEFHTQHSLHDLGINYGALVPENESTLAYIARGLFGGYQAGFSDQDYYRYDLTYSRTEFRDMWEYELNLSNYQTKLLIYHLWEIAGKKFTYYFLKENCAYRLAELLELLTAEDYLAGVDLWYTPISLFQRMHELDAQRPAGEKLIRSVTFIPSSQRVLYRNLEELTDSELGLINRVILEPGTDLPHLVEGLDPASRLRVLDGLLAYFEYRLIDRDEGELPALRRAKNRAVSLRLSLPASREPLSADVVRRRSPASGAAPSVAAVGYGYDEAAGSQVALRYSPFRYDGVGNNTLHGSELIVLDVSVLLGRSSQVSLDRVDIIRARKVNLNVIDLAGEATYSWEVGLGVQRERNDCRNCNEGFAEGRLGRTVYVSGPWIAMAYLGGTLGSGESPYRMQGGISMLLMSGARWRTEIDLGYEYGLEEDEGYARGAMISRFSIAQQHELRLEVAEHHGVSAKLYYAWHW